MYGISYRIGVVNTYYFNDTKEWHNDSIPVTIMK